MNSLAFKSKHWLGPFLIALSCLLVALTEPLVNEVMPYNRTEINNFQLWRLFTGHLMHTNVIHLTLNLLGLILLWALHGQYYKTKQYLVVFSILALGTSTGLYLFVSDLQWYVGMSGILHGLFVLGAFFDIRHQMKTGWVLFIGVWLKVIHEQIYGASQNVASLIEANVAIDAHLYGTIAGTLILLYYFLLFKLKRKNENE